MVREWRKLHKAIASSERLAHVSYEARWLYTLLLAMQDDSGAYPWTRTMVRTLTSTTDWTFAEATEFREGLEGAGLGWMDGSRFVLRKGADMNGTPASEKGGSGARTPRYYPEEQAPQEEHGDTDALRKPYADDAQALRRSYALDKRREDKRREDKRREEESVVVVSAHADARVGKLATLYEREIGILSPVAREQILALIDTLDPPESWLEDAVREAVRQNHRNLSYIRGILENWRTHGKGDRPPRSNRNGTPTGQSGEPVQPPNANKLKGQRRREAQQRHQHD